jgi:diguanylate cyclase (GGDEF)-like protein
VSAGRAWRWYLTGGAALTAVTVALPPGPARSILYLVVALSLPVAVALGIRGHRPRRATGWWLLAAGAALWVLGDATWTWIEDVAGQSGDGTAADPFYLAAYPVLSVALHLAARGRRRDGELAGLLDALSITLGAGLVLWVFVLEPAWSATQGPWPERVVVAAYPVGDLVVVLQLAALLTGPVRRSVALRLLTAAMAAVLLADAGYQLLASWPALAPLEPWLDPFWLGAYVLWGVAALHPSMVEVTDGRRRDGTEFTVGRIVALGTVFAVLPAVTLVVVWLGRPQPTFAVELVHGALVVLVVVRLLEVVRTVRAQSDRLSHLASTDFLTGLANRRAFNLAIEDVLDADRCEPRAVLLVGLERFAEVNESLGHRTGDEVLRSVGSALVATAGPGGLVARIGGAVFGVLLRIEGPGSAAAAAARVRARFVEPLEVSGLRITVDAAVGVVVLPDDEPDPDQVLERGDVSLTVARTSGGVARYSRAMEEAGASSQLMAELAAAMTAGDVVVHFQPQVEVATGRVIGAEALVRWLHPRRGMIPPLAFIPAAERTGLIRPLTLVVLDQAVAGCAAWLRDGRELSVAVNLSVRNLLDPALVGDVTAILERHGLPPDRLELEITETSAMVDPVRASAVLTELAGLGVMLSIDDYGTGYGSLAYLQRLPVRQLKIDRAFVGTMTTDESSAAIVHSTVDLARHLGLSVVAEGVEDDATLLALRDMRCFAAQGFVLSRPVPAVGLAAAVERIERSVPQVVGRVLRPEPLAAPGVLREPVADVGGDGAPLVEQGVLLAEPGRAAGS